jgi:hypothetical protein
MPNGKPAGGRCIHLTDDMKCAIFESPDRRKGCDAFQAESEFCGYSQEEAMKILGELE